MAHPALSPCVRQTNKLIITRELRESLDILQMPVVDLQIYLTDQLTDNCMLDLQANEGDEANSCQDDDFVPGQWSLDPGDGNDDNDRLGYILDNHRFGLHHESIQSLQSGNESEGIENAPGLINNLQDYLLFQLHLAGTSLLEERVGRYLIGNIDSSGYLRCTTADAALDLQVVPEQVTEILALIQSFEPCGVGARSLAESLRLQLEANPAFRSDRETYQTAIEIISGYLNELAERKLNYIAQRLKKTTDQIRLAAHLIRGLEPKPGKNFSPPGLCEYIVPDVYIQKSGAEFLIYINEPEENRLIINPVYRELLNKSWLYPLETVDYLKRKMKAALRLIKNIRQRQLTLYRISEAILRLQESFFNHGIAELKPMMLRDVAEATGLHESTVSRCIDGKYLDTPLGVFAMKFFFNSGLGGKDECVVLSHPLETPAELISGVASATAVKNLIKTEIDRESKDMPWSDQQLAERLKNQGIHISRRTVTKYREGMKIPPSQLRRPL